VALAALGLVTIVLWQLIALTISGLNQVFGTAATTTSVPRLQLRHIYVVSVGDTVNGIAARFGISERELANANHIRQPNLIVLGQKLIIPTPDHPRLTRHIIRVIAKQYGLDPAFALGVADEESGFNENVISPTGAIGVMQIEPATGRQLAKDIGRPINLGLERDNISCGVYWLHYLVRYYGGSERSAAAAYNEGQGNLSAHGYLAGVKQYVDNVMALRNRYAGRA
jgi:LysM repeat protein